MALNTEKYINVYYNKGDRKPYDVNGKPIAYLGADYVGANEATIIRFFIGDNTGVTQAVADVKRADGEKAFLLMSPITVNTDVFYELPLTDWHTSKVGKLVVAFRGYNGAITVVDGEIQANNLRIIVSDIFNIDIGYSPNSIEEAPAFDPNDVSTFISALSSKLNKADGINVVQALPTPNDGSLNGHWYLVKTGANSQLGKLYVFSGNNAIAVELEAGGIKLTPTGNGDITTDTGRIDWEQPNGTASLGLYNGVFAQLGEDVFYYVKASGAITKGDVIQYAGYQGDHALAKRAVQAEVNANPKLIMGIAKNDIVNGDFGYVAHFGKIESIDTKSQAVNSFVYFDSSGVTAGNWVITQPTAPNAKILLGVIIKAETSAGANNGIILVRPVVEPSIKELQDVNVTSIANNQVLRWNNTNLRWENTSALTTAETDIDALEGRMTTEEGNVDNLQGRMTTAEGNIDDIEDGTTIVPKANADKDNNEFDATYLKKASATATYIPLSQKGANNGVVPLNSSGKISSIYLSGEQDDIQEFANLASFPAVGEADILYVAIDTNKLYRWSGSAYVVISETLALGTTNSTAFPGDRGLALETLTDNIVDGDQALALKNQVIRNTVVGTSPLVVNSIVSTTANLTEFQVNGTKVLEVTPAGNLLKNGNLFLHNTGSASTGVGDRANRFGGVSATAVGHLALFSANATANTAVGHASLFDATGGGNTVVGESGGRSITTGANNTFLGNASGYNASQLISATNSTAIGNGSFTDASNQMVFGNASVTEFKFDRNASAEALLPRLTASSSSIHKITRISALTSESRTPLTIRHQTSDDMVTGFGTSLTFAIQDSANVENLIASIQGIRTGADNSGRLTLQTANAGTLTEKMTILPNGNVGIGATSPSGRLYVAGVGGLTSEAILTLRDTSANGSNTTLGGVAFSSSPGFDFYIAKKSVNTIGYLSFGNANNSTEYMSILSSGNVGIGTASPASQLEIKSTGLTQLTITGGSVENFPLLQLRDEEAGGSNWNIENGREGDGILGFYNGSGGGNKVAITQAGNVGIGTSSPARLLSLNAGNADGIQIRVSSDVTGNYGALGFRIAPTESANNFAEIRAIRTNRAIGADTDLTFHTISNTSLGERMRIRDDGLVGINESSFTTNVAQLVVKSGATDRVPLIVDTLASHATQIQEWRKNTTLTSFIDVDGRYRGIGIASLTFSNANMSLSNNGAIISRNIADSNPALIVNSVQGTSHIQVWQFGGNAVSQIGRNGVFIGETRARQTEQTGNYTLALADEGKVLRVNSSSNRTVTIPLNSSVAFPIDTEIAILRYGTGTVSISPTAGVTLESKAGERKISGQFGSVALKKIGENEWVLVGSLEA